ncbi:MAG: saccharopine dehydrogenase family protein [Candidatus Moraniibacteriota bacterium]
MSRMLVIGAGGVANVYLVMAARLAKSSETFSHLILASRRLESCQKIRANVLERTGEKVDIYVVDANNPTALVELIEKINPDLVVNLATPTTDLAVMAACHSTAKPYLDTANYEPPEEPNFRYEWQWGMGPLFEMSKNLAILGGGFDPGATNIYIAYALKHYFDEIYEVDIVDCNAGIHGHKFATNFDPQTNIREVTKDGKFWEDGHWVEIEPIVGAKPGRDCYRYSFNFPEVGSCEMFLIFHEELQSLVKFLERKGLRRIRFWMTFGQNYLTHLWALQNVGMTRIEPIEIAGVKISPLDFLARVLPEPSTLGANYTGKTCIGCRMTGIKNGQAKKVMIYNVCDHADAYAMTGGQAITFTTAMPTLAITKLICDGVWSGTGVRNVEEFDPDPAMQLMTEFGLPWKILEDDDVPDLNHDNA